MIEPNVLQPNLVPITLEDLNIQEGMDVEGTPVANTPTPPPADLNIQVSSNGSIMSIGNLQSTNFHAGSSGWRLDSNGNIEANDGNFRGDISGASGTFTGSVTTSAIIAIGGSIGNWTISSLALYFDGATDAVSSGMAPADYPFYAGKKYADRATAPFKVEPSGKLTVASIVATGTINAQAGYLSAGVYLDTSNGLVCESGGLNVGVAGHIRGGQTDYNTGTGFFLGYDTDAYKFSLGVSTGSYLIWNGINLEISGKIKAESIEWKGRTIIPVFESLDGWITSIDSDGSITPYVGTVEVTPGTTTDDVTELHIEGASENITMTNNPFFQATIKVGDITYQDMEICSGYSAFAPAYGTRFGFRWSATDNKLYAFHYASSSETKTEMTGISMEGYVNHYRAEMSDGGDTIKFYVNGVLKATHTNADCGVDTSILISMGGKNISGQNGIYFSNLIFAQDF